MEKRERGFAQWFVLPLLSLGFVAAWYTTREAPATSGAATASTLEVAALPPEGRADLPPTRVSGDFPLQGAFHPQAETPTEPERTRAIYYTLPSSSPSSTEPKAGRYGTQKIIDFGNRQGGIYAPLVAKVGKGYRNSSLTNSAEVAMAMKAQIDFLGNRMVPWRIYSKTYTYSGSYSGVEAWTNREILGKETWRGIGNGSQGSYIYQIVYYVVLPLDVIGIPVQLGFKVYLSDLIRATHAGSTSSGSAAVFGDGKTMVWGAAWVSVGAFGFYVGIEASLNFLSAGPEWNLAATFKTLGIQKAEWEVKAFSLKLKGFVQATLWKEYVTFFSTGSLFTWTWACSWKDYVWW